MKWNITGLRLWLFRFLVVIAAAFMLASFAMPWWQVRLAGASGYGTIHVYAYGIHANPTMLIVMQYLANDITPFYQIVLAWLYVTATVGLAIYSTCLKAKMSLLLLGITGITYIAYAVVAVFIVIAHRAADFGIPLQGVINLNDVGSNVQTSTQLETGYYMAYAAGGLFIIMALLRGLITGKFKAAMEP